MKKIFYFLIAVLFLQTHFAYASLRVNLEKGYVTTPDSSIAKKSDAGKRMHTNYKIYTPYQITHGELPGGETPASLACVYGLTKLVLGCPIATTTAVPNGGWGAIALVDAYDNPNAELDLAIFSAQFNLPPCTTANGCFQKVYASGQKPAEDVDWGVEEALDIEWAHAMAPNAKIILVEANSNSNFDLFFAEDVASRLVSLYGGGEVSNSWGGSEFLGEIFNDIHFQTPGIVYFASSGDDAAPANYPSASPYVVSSGGTSIIRGSFGYFLQETAWSFDPARNWGSSGGPSLYEPRPHYQNSVQNIVGTQRGTPDIAFDANPETGVDVYEVSKGGWIIVGGTSVSSPSLAGIINSANMRARSAPQELAYIYAQAQKSYNVFWRDIIIGNNGYPTLIGYDLVTGLGSPISYRGK